MVGGGSAPAYFPSTVRTSNFPAWIGLSAGSRSDKLQTIAPKNSMVSGSPGCISGSSTCFAYCRMGTWSVFEDEGKAIIWRTKGMGVTAERLALWTILSHPQARITVRPNK